MPPASVASAGNRGLHDRAVGDVGVTGHGADRRASSPSRLTPTSSRDLAQIDERGRRGEALLHRRNERLPAGEQLGVLVREIGERAGDTGWDDNR